MITRAKFLQSMSRADNCYDDGCMESGFGRIKTELDAYTNTENARKKIRQYIHYFNGKRRHS